MTDVVTAYRAIAGLIDHALLSPALSWDELQAGIQLARAHEVASVCILPYAVGECAAMLQGSQVVPSTTIGFPHGAQPAAVKAFEAETAISQGCMELDMVVNISEVKSGRWTSVQDEIRAVVEIAHDAGRKVKVIFETCYLTDDQKRRLCGLCGDLQADWVKTSTGFGTQGATLDDVRLMRRHSPDVTQVKASGGIRTLDDLRAFQTAGATRIGTSHTQTILTSLRKELGLPPITPPQQALLPPAGY